MNGFARAVVASIEGVPLSVPLREPFVIATGKIDVTRAVLVRATVRDAAGRQATGYGEAAALPPVTREDQPDLLAAIARTALAAGGMPLTSFDTLAADLQGMLPTSAVARSGIECALLDAWARMADVPLFRAWSDEAAPATTDGSAHPSQPAALVTDITLPISQPDHMSSLALSHRTAGFTCFKVKVGRDWRADRACLRAVAAAVPDARFRLDANAGFTPRDALALLEGTLADGSLVECYEQPCAREDFAGMAEVTAHSPVPVVADESFRGAADLERIVSMRAAHAINLKLVKLGGPLTSLALARRARAAGLRLMAGAMVETRVGLVAMAHVVSALGGVDWVDLDTAFLLADDPFTGGWQVRGPHLQVTDQPGLGLSLR